MFKFLVALHKVYHSFLGTITNAESVSGATLPKKRAHSPFGRTPACTFSVLEKIFSAQSMVMDQAKVFSAPGASVS